jgi:hypothetical protein
MPLLNTDTTRTSDWVSAAGGKNLKTIYMLVPLFWTLLLSIPSFLQPGMVKHEREALFTVTILMLFFQGQNLSEMFKSNKFIRL